MNKILDLLINYWKPIVGLLFTIAGFIIALIKKRPLNDILSYIYKWSILAINDTEIFSKFNKIEPEVKLARAVEFVFNRFKEKYPTLDPVKYSVLIKYVIESILSTPQKHNEVK